MADKTTMSAYQKSGYAQASGVPELQTQANNIKVDPAALKQQAEAQYKPTYEAEQRSLNTQLTALIKSQRDDSDLLNKQYQQSINTMMEKIKARGLATGSLPQVQTDALNKFHNEVMTQRQVLYGVQQAGVQSLIDTHKNDYDLNVEARMATIKDNSLQSLSNLLAQIAKLQNSSYTDYINYLLAKSKKHSDGGGGYGGRYRRYSGGSSSTPTAETTNTGPSADYYAQTKSGSPRPAGEAPRTTSIPMKNAYNSKIHRTN